MDSNEPLGKIEFALVENVKIFQKVTLGLSLDYEMCQSLGNSQSLANTRILGSAHDGLHVGLSWFLWAQAWKHQTATAQFRNWRTEGEISPRRQVLEAQENSEYEGRCRKKKPQQQKWQKWHRDFKNKREQKEGEALEFKQEIEKKIKTKNSWKPC